MADMLENPSEICKDDELGMVGRNVYRSAGAAIDDVVVV